MAFVKDAVLDGFKRDVELNFNALEERVIELEKLLKQYNGGVTVDEVVPEPEPEVVEEEEVVEDVAEDVTDLIFWVLYAVTIPIVLGKGTPFTSICSPLENIPDV